MLLRPFVFVRSDFSGRMPRLPTALAPLLAPYRPVQSDPKAATGVSNFEGDHELLSRTQMLVRDRRMA